MSAERADIKFMNGFNLESPDNKKAVLLLHGMTGGPIEMKQLGKHLHNAGYNVYCPILPGHCNGAEYVKNTIWQDWHKFSITQFDELYQNYDEVYVSGLCLGAVLAFDIAQERQKKVSAVCGLSTTLFLDGWKVPWYKFLFPLGLYTVLKFFYSFPDSEPYGIKNEKLRKKVEKMVKENPAILDCFPMVSIGELLSISKFVRKNVHKIKSPILLIHSKLDDLTSTKSADYIYKNVSSQTKEYIKLNDSYHLIMRDNEKQFVFEKMINFFDTVSKQRFSMQSISYTSFSTSPSFLAEEG